MACSASPTYLASALAGVPSPFLSFGSSLSSPRALTVAVHHLSASPSAVRHQAAAYEGASVDPSGLTALFLLVLAVDDSEGNADALRVSHALRILAAKETSVIVMGTTFNRLGPSRSPRWRYATVNVSASSSTTKRHRLQTTEY
ncbi:hypothetical protein OH77DRAFT_1430411 [Trametes cingulata]|nr:hypothetical protein OH77DRAFT_1430411 [Trametes cingulata]